MATIEIDTHEYLCWIEAPWKGTALGPEQWFTENSRRFLFSREHIVESAVPYEPGDGCNTGGIYFLVGDDEVLYVGISKSIQRRLCEHWELGRWDRAQRFAKYWCIGGMPEGWAHAVETFYIHYLQTPWNDKYPGIGLNIRRYLDLASKGQLW